MTDQRDAKDRGKRTLDRAIDEVEREAPDWAERAIEWLRDPAAKWIRIPLGLLFVAASFFAFLPVLGIELLPLGLMLLALDIPFLREPVGRFLLWLADRWRALKRWWRGR